MSQGLAVGVDVGGTKLLAGLVAADGTVVARVRRTTPADSGPAIVDVVVDTVEELLAANGARGLPVGVGAAGLVGLDGVVRYAPNIRWTDYPLRQRLVDRLGVPVTVDNDANTAAWAEYRAGAGARAAESMLMLTLGTGVGGGLVAEGRLARGSGGLGAEFGHIVVSEGGPRCGCGNHGCLEALASGSAIARTARDALQSGEAPPGSALRQIDELTGKSVTVAAYAGDAFAAEVLRRCGFWLGVGIASLVNALDPEIVVIGGGAMQAGDLLLEPARRSCLERVMGQAYRTVPAIVRAKLADDAGMIGAALLAMAASTVEPAV